MIQGSCDRIFVNRLLDCIDEVLATAHVIE